MPFQPVTGSIPSTNAQIKENEASEPLKSVDTASNRIDLVPAEVVPYIPSMVLAKQIGGSGRRVDIPIRKSFVRASNPGVETPLAKIVSRGGGGGAVALKLYIAIIWRCSGREFETDIAARLWAGLLGLDDPNVKGARRIAKALKLLSELNLIKLTPRRGESSIVQLLDESGNGNPYQLPSTAYVKMEQERDRYLKVPSVLWTQSAQMQRMSASALTMLLILLCEGSGETAHKLSTEGKPVWMSVERFTERYPISPAMRSRGTKDLISMALLHVHRAPVGTMANKKSFASEQVRNIYTLQNNALVFTEPKASNNPKSSGKP